MWFGVWEGIKRAGLVNNRLVGWTEAGERGVDILKVGGVEGVE